MADRQGRIKKGAVKEMSDIKAVKKIATREAYGNALAEFGEAYPNMIVLDADLAAATKTGVFKKRFPERHIDCGIAEANMMGIGNPMISFSRLMTTVLRRTGINDRLENSLINWSNPTHALFDGSY